MSNRYNKNTKETQRKIRVRNKAYLRKYLEEHPCVDCGETDIRCLEFDHIDRSTKSQNVGRMCSSMHYSLVRIQKEIEKCIVRCANCHRKKTYFDMNWTK